MRIKKVYHLLDAVYSESYSLLDYETAFQLLIAVLLSAQTTDAKVNEVTPLLWQKYPTVADLAQASLPELEACISVIGLYRRKARYILENATLFLEKYKGTMPSAMDELLCFSGIGRKSANVIRVHIFDLPGIIVDTHFMRVNRRLQFCGMNESAEAIEKTIAHSIEPSYHSRYSMVINYHGRFVCKATKPLCQECVLKDLCPSFAL